MEASAPEPLRTPTIRELPKDDQPREKLARLGVEGLTDAELIAIILRTGSGDVNVVEMARRMIAKYGSLGALARCSVKELTTLRGIGPVKAQQLAAVFGLGYRLAQEKMAAQKLDSPELIYELLGAEMRLLQKESLRVVLLNTKLQRMRVEQVSLGSLNESIAHPREILQPVLLYSAYAFILVHNHPSGDPAPSDADRRLTTRLAEACRLLQVNFQDHVIIGSAGHGRHPYFSFREAGMIG